MKNVETYINARKVSNLKYPDTSSYLELDLWIPSIGIAFEFQDAHHYVASWYNHNTQVKIQSQDIMKNAQALKNNITIIIVPCWWEGSRESLAASICFHRPDLFAKAGDYLFPIPLNPSIGFFPSTSLPEIGELMLASFPLDPNFVVPEQTWWMGEKYDGIRCCWNPLRLNMRYTRTGKALLIVSSMLDNLPPIFIDGELWFGRGQYSLAYSLINYSESVSWPFLRLVAFDVPMQNESFEHRYALLLPALTDYPVHEVGMRILCESPKHMKHFVEGVIDNEGEGVILRRITSLYEPGRSPALIKLKTAYGDREAIVVGLDRSAVQLKLPNGDTFVVPPHQVLIPTPMIGDVVTFSYESHARRDLPVNPKIYRVRTDISWEEVLYNSSNEKQYLNDRSHLPGFTKNPTGFWTSNKMRAFLEGFAKRRNMDPLLPESWYSVPYQAIAEFKAGRAILKKFKGYFSGLQSVFPEVSFSRKGFLQASWTDVTKRRKFFEDYAEANNFDPLVRENWYSQPTDKIRAAKGALRVLSYHNNQVFKALADLFPNIGLEKPKFFALSSYYFRVNRKKFFESYARANNFDPLNPNQWYAQSPEKLLALKGTSKIIWFHGGSLTNTLLDLFPNIGLAKSKIWGKKPYNVEGNRRAFFINYAKENQFDPLNPSNWYSEREKIRSIKGINRLLSYHHNSVLRALLDLFPDIGFDKSKFFAQSFWSDSAKRKKFFIEYAQKNGFNPRVPENWYKQQKARIMSIKGALKIISHHNNSLVRALVDLFPDIGLVQDKFKPNMQYVKD